MSNYESPWMNDELRMYRKTVREFLREEFLPCQAKWRDNPGYGYILEWLDASHAEIVSNLF